MSLEQELTDRLTQAIKTKDAPTADVVRMIKTRIQERRTAKDFSGTINDTVVLEVIGAYRKLLQKAIAEYEKLGERGAEQAAKLRFEIGFCEATCPRASTRRRCARWSRSASVPSASPTSSRSGVSWETS
jgi:uncharacterized protein YqeY